MAGKMEHGVNTLEGYAQSLLKLNMHLLFDPTSTFMNTNTAYIYRKMDQKAQSRAISNCSNKGQPKCKKSQRINCDRPTFCNTAQL